MTELNAGERWLEADWLVAEGRLDGWRLEAGAVGKGRVAGWLEDGWRMVGVLQLQFWNLLTFMHIKTLH